MGILTSGDFVCAKAGLFAGKISIGIVLGALAFTSPASADPSTTVPITSCSGATVTGAVADFPGGASGQMRQFLGIPYAAPPTGTNRWNPPQSNCWSGDLTAQVFGKVCPQGFSLSSFASEDCLFLNVFTPPTGDYSNLPVMVFIHGGGLTSGSASFFAQNPVPLVEQGVIVVTINYRLGALGFLAHAALDNKATRNTGNYGILDQQAALTWVKDNIAAFGGNPGNVTIFGQSAGGLSVLVHLLSPLSDGLFHKAIIESGAIGPITPLVGGESQGAGFATSTGCSSDTADCLRALPVDTILANQSIIGQSSLLLKNDGVVLLNSFENLLGSGAFKKVPIMLGTGHDEQRFHLAYNQAVGSGNSCSYTSNIKPTNYLSALQTTFGGLSPMVQKEYKPGKTPLTANIAFTDAQTDRNFVCRALRTSNAIAKKAGTLYVYEINDKNPPVYQNGPITLSDNTIFPQGAYHGVEANYLFAMPGTVSCGLPYPGLTAAQDQLADAMVTYWTTFAKTGNPNPAAGVKPPLWPLFTGAKGKLMSLESPVPKVLATSKFNSDHNCKFWDAHQ